MKTKTFEISKQLLMSAVADLVVNKQKVNKKSVANAIDNALFDIISEGICNKAPFPNHEEELESMGKSWNDIALLAEQIY